MTNPEVIPPKDRGRKPRRRRSPPIDETDEQRKQRKGFQQVVETGYMDDEFYVREPNDIERGIVRSMVFAGITHEKIAACLSIEIRRLKYLFQKELDHGREMMVAEIAYTLAARARTGSDAAAIYLLKVRGGPAFSEARATREAGGTDDPGSGDPALVAKTDKAVLIGAIMEMIKKANDAKTVGEEKND